MYASVGILGFFLGFIMVIFSGKERKSSVTSDPPRAANVLIMKVMVSDSNANVFLPLYTEWQWHSQGLPESQNKDKNEESLRKNKKKMMQI